MTISAAQVKELRDISGVGMMECKKALTETDGDVEKALDLLRSNSALTVSYTHLTLPTKA